MGVFDVKASELPDGAVNERDDKMEETKANRTAEDMEEVKENESTGNMGRIRTDDSSEEMEETEDAGKSCCCHCGGDEERHKERTNAERKALLRRLSIIEGQIRGIRGMVERDVYCIDILTQVSAANSALNSFARELAANHMNSCVVDDIQEGSREKLDEFLKVLPKLMK